MIAGVLIAWILLRHTNTAVVSMFSLPGDPPAIARLLFRDFLLPFEVTSVLILIAIMGAVVLASKPEAVARPSAAEPAQREVRELVASGRER